MPVLLRPPAPVRGVVQVELAESGPCRVWFEDGRVVRLHFESDLLRLGLTWDELRGWPREPSLAWATP